MSTAPPQIPQTPYDDIIALYGGKAVRRSKEKREALDLLNALRLAWLAGFGKAMVELGEQIDRQEKTLQRNEQRLTQASADLVRIETQMETLRP